MENKESLLNCVVEPRTLIRQNDCINPAEVFGITADETRLTILDALWRSSDRPISFSELRKRTNMGTSSRFNYHLGKLTGPFISKTDDGYDLRPAGRQIVQAVRAGSLTEQPYLKPFSLNDDCCACGSPLEVRYLDNSLSIACTGCQRVYGRHTFPPAGLNDRSRSELIEAFNHRVRHHYSLALKTVCPECGGRTSTSLRDAEKDAARASVHLVIQCSHCHEKWHAPIGFALLERTNVVAFYQEHGVDLHRKRYWQLDWCATNKRTTVLAEDPYQIRIVISIDDEELCLTLDNNLNIINSKLTQIKS